MSDKIENLKQKREQLDARIESLEAAEKTRQTKKDLRRKILIGAYFLDEAKRAGSLEALSSKLEGYLKREADRALFGLKPLKPRESVKASQETEKERA